MIRMNRPMRVLAALLLVFSGRACLSMTLVHGATMLTLAEGDDEAFVGYLLFDGGRIKAVGRGPYTGADVGEALDATGRIVIPGFLSGHSHLWQSAFRGIAADRELYGWAEALHWTYGEHLSDGDFYNFTLHGALDQLAHGVTTTFNHSQRLMAPESVYMESLPASVDSGQRFIFAYNADRHLPEQAMRDAVAAMVESARPYLRSGALLGLAMNVPGPRSDLGKFRLEIELARQHGLTVQIHYLEEHARRFLERRQWPVFLDAGAVAGNVSFAHFIHTTDGILADAAARGASMIWNPLSNGRLGSGLPDIPRYLELGIGVGMGLDSTASADVADPFENMRMGMYALRMKHASASVMLPIEVLRLHTLATARVLGVAGEVGSLEAGKRADFLILDPAEPVTGAIFDPVATLVLSCAAANIEAVYVGGERLVEEGRPLRHDLAAIQRELEQRVARIRAAARPGQ
jgi:cytosine/adenosine deaminase-related metal-dependent hydrolase